MAQIRGTFRTPAMSYDVSRDARQTSRKLGLLRYCLIHTLIAVVLGGSLFDVITRREDWPFSPYDLYSGVVRDPSLTLLRLYGLPAGRPANEFPLIKIQYIQPFDNARLRFALRQLDRDKNRDPLLAEALRDCLRRYAALGAAARHSGPRLGGIRLYRVRWNLDPRARNLHSPDAKELLYEVSE